MISCSHSGSTGVAGATGVGGNGNGGTNGGSGGVSGSGGGGSVAGGNSGKGHVKSASVSSPGPSADGTAVALTADPLRQRYFFFVEKKMLNF